MSLIKYLFVNPVIKAEIKRQEIKLKQQTDKYSHKMSMQNKAHLYAMKERIIYSIKVLKEML